MPFSRQITLLVAVGSMIVAMAALADRVATGTLGVSVTDAASSSPLANATVSVTPIEVEAVTPNTGYCDMSLPVGSYILEITRHGYQDVVVPNVIVDEDASVQVTVELLAAEPARGAPATSPRY